MIKHKLEYFGHNCSVSFPEEQTFNRLVYERHLKAGILYAIAALCFFFAMTTPTSEFRLIGFFIAAIPFFLAVIMIINTFRAKRRMRRRVAVYGIR